MDKKVLILFLFLIIVTCDSARILGVFPTASISHQVVFRPLMAELAKRGHEVVVITPDPAYPKGETPPNLTEIDVHDISYNLHTPFFKQNAARITDFKIIGMGVYRKFAEYFIVQMKSPQVQELFNNKNITFDLIFTESCFRPAIAVSHLYKVPVIDYSTMDGQHGSYEMIGAVTHPLIFPISVAQRIQNMTLWEKIESLYTRFYVDYYYSLLEEEENQMLRTVFGEDMPDLSVLKNNVKMLFLNVHPLWDLNRPVPPSVLYLGGSGTHLPPVKELPQDLKTYLDSSKNGVIYVSFGTNNRPSLLPPDKLKIMTKVFSELPYDILWKWDVLDYPDRPKNVKIGLWFPQSDLLRHPKVKLFITQQGLQSTDEAIAAGMPVVGIPMLWDQWYNAEMCQIHKMGIKVLLETLTEHSLKSAIETIFNNYQSYRDNAVKLRTLLRDQKESPLERAVWWTEHVLRTGGDHLRSPIANMSWSEYYQLDLILFILAVLLAITIVIISVIRYIISKFNNIIKIKIKTK